jgi:glycosyltransferase involved in cell wall biosynthesis
MRNILFVTHTNPNKAKVYGGTELLVQKIMQNYEPTVMNIFIMYPNRNKNESGWVIESKGECIAQFPILRKTQRFSGRNFEDWISGFLTKYNVDVLHVFHQLGTPTNLIPLAKLLGINTIYTIHDFVHVCDSFNLINSNREFCNVFESQENHCVGCATSRGVNPKDLLSRRIAYKRVLEDTDFILAGSQNSRDATSQYYSIDISKFKIIPPLMPIEHIRIDEPKVKSVLFLGNFTLPKGAEIIIKIVSNPRLRGFSFIQAGRVDDEFVHMVQEMERNYDFVSLGRYELEDLPKVNCSVAFFGSIWPETFCITATEASYMGLKIVIPDLGAFVDRFESSDNSYFYSSGDIDSAIDAILLADRSERSEKESSEVSWNYEDLVYDLYTGMEILPTNNSKDVDFRPVDWGAYFLSSFEILASASQSKTKHKLAKLYDYYRSFGFLNTVKRVKREFLG